MSSTQLVITASDEIAAFTSLVAITLWTVTDMRHPPASMGGGRGQTLAPPSGTTIRCYCTETRDCVTVCNCKIKPAIKWQLTLLVLNVDEWQLAERDENLQLSSSEMWLLLPSCNDNEESSSNAKYRSTSLVQPPVLSSDRSNDNTRLVVTSLSSTLHDTRFAPSTCAHAQTPTW